MKREPFEITDDLIEEIQEVMGNIRWHGISTAEGESVGQLMRDISSYSAYLKDQGEGRLVKYLKVVRDKINKAIPALEDHLSSELSRVLLGVPDDSTEDDDEDDGW